MVVFTATSPEHFSNIRRVLDTKPPKHLFHYTSPEVLIKVVEHQELWATHVRFFNDFKELGHAIDYVRDGIDRRLTNEYYKGAYSPVEQEGLRLMARYAGVMAGSTFNVFIASLTEEGDQLSQWRAYCPASGGCAIGFPSSRLMAAAVAQGFYLTPCIYEHATQFQIVNDIVEHHIASYRNRVSAGQDPDDVREQMARAFALDVSRYGPILKHPSFKEEKEWRLVSPQFETGNPTIAYRPGKGSVVPYYKFSLLSKEYPNLTSTPGDTENSLGVIVGPTSDVEAAYAAVESFLRSKLGLGPWYNHSRIPYRSG